MTKRRRLIKEWLDGEFDPRVWDDMNHELASSDEAIREFAREVHLQYLIRNELLSNPEGDGVTAVSRISETVPGVSFYRRYRPLFAGLACLVVVAVGMLLLPRSEPAGEQAKAAFQSDSTTLPESAIQTVQPSIGVIDFVFPGTSVPLEAGKHLGAGERLVFNGGGVRLRTTSGVIIDLAEKVDFELLSALRALLRSGRLTAFVQEEQGRGFTVVTAEAEIVDLGTRFGVNIGEDGDANVVVFSGSVDVHYPQAGQEQSQKTQRLLVGEALRLKQGERLPVIIIEKGRGPANWSTTVRDPECAIARINDNFVGPDQPIYYGVIPRGFREDAVAYVDRPFEWNSLPGIPFPKELLNGDYIQTINNLKYIVNLQIEVELRCDADVYVLMDERVSTPAWLKNNFEKTSLRVGVDETHPPPVPVQHWKRPGSVASMRSLGHGPGESVDYSYAVWKSHRKAGSVVEFGSLYDSGSPPGKPLPQAYSMQWISMYGIVVVPSR